MEKREHGPIQRLPIFKYPYYLKNVLSYELQIWQMHLDRPCEKKPLNYLGEKGALAYPGTVEFFSVPPIISGTRKATNFKFGRYIHSIHANKSRVNICEKRERGISRDGPNFFSTPYYLRNAQSYEIQVWQVYSVGPFKTALKTYLHSIQ